MTHTWKFIATAGGGPSTWCWVHCIENRVLERSTYGFAAFPDCVAEARRHGFDLSHRFDVLTDRRKKPRLAA